MSPTNQTIDSRTLVNCQHCGKPTNFASALNLLLKRSVEHRAALNQACDYGRAHLHLSIQVLDSLFIKTQDPLIPECAGQLRALLKLCHIATCDVTESPPSPGFVPSGLQLCRKCGWHHEPNDKCVKTDAEIKLLADLKDAANAAHIEAWNLSKCDECSDVDYKLANGSFGKAELDAHRKVAELMGFHNFAYDFLGKQAGE